VLTVGVRHVNPPTQVQLLRTGSERLKEAFVHVEHPSDVLVPTLSVRQVGVAVDRDDFVSVVGVRIPLKGLTACLGLILWAFLGRRGYPSPVMMTFRGAAGVLVAGAAPARSSRPVWLSRWSPLHDWPSQRLFGGQGAS